VTAKKQVRKTVPKKAPPQLVQLLTLKLIRLVSSESLLRLNAGGHPKNSKLVVKTKFGKSTEDETLGGELSCEVTSHYEGQSDPAIVIRCAFQMVYTMAGGASLPTEKQIKHESQQISAMLSIQAWPYVREHVQGMSLKMGLPALVLQPLVWSTFVEQGGRLRVELRPAGPPPQHRIEGPTQAPQRKLRKTPR
jgi:hypothetical protein